MFYSLSFNACLLRRKSQSWVYFCGVIPSLLYNMGSSVLRAVGDAKRPLYFLIFTTVVNIGLDVLFVAVFKMGLTGAAVATALSQFVGGLIPLIYFCCKNSSLLRFTKFRFNGKALCKTVTNGSSELMSNISMSIVGMLYNFQLLKYAGENGVAAYGVLMYVNLVFQAVFLGFSVGIAPVISFNMGANNYEELKNLRKKCLMVIGVFSVAMFVLAETLAKPLSYVFVGYDGARLNGKGVLYLFLLLFVFGIFHFRVIVFYGFKRRIGFGIDCFSKDACFPGHSRAVSAADI